MRTLGGGGVLNGMDCKLGPVVHAGGREAWIGAPQHGMSCWISSRDSQRL